MVHKIEDLTQIIIPNKINPLLLTLIDKIFVKFLMIKYCFFFQTFFNSGAMGSVCDTFCIYHVIAPGQEPGAEDLPEGFCYPTMDELSEQVSYLYVSSD